MVAEATQALGVTKMESTDPYKRCSPQARSTNAEL